MLFSCCFLFCMMKMCFILASENSGHVVMIASPSHFTLGLTPELTLACRFKKEDFPRMSAVSSMVLYYSSFGEDPEYNYVASASVFEGLSYDLTETAKVFGAVSNNNTSFLELQFKFPSKNAAGVYRCAVHGMERFGKPLTIYNTVELKGLTPDLSDIVDKLQALTIANDDLKRALREVKEETATRLKDMRQAYGYIVFDYSPVTNRRRYALSTDQTYLSYAESQRLCGLYGGYLAEIDNKEEFDFVQNYVANKKIYQLVLIGGTDELQEGVFINEHNNNGSAYVVWRGFEPNGGRAENCLCLYKGQGWTSGTFYCSLDAIDLGAMAFLCEIPSE